MPFKLNLPPVAQCDRKKTRYHSKYAAEVDLEVKRRFYSQNAYKDTSSLEVYFCDICQAWHFGEPTQKDLQKTAAAANLPKISNGIRRRTAT